LGSRTGHRFSASACCWWVWSPSRWLRW